MIPSAYATSPTCGGYNTPPVSAFLKHRRNWQQRQLTNDPANEVFAKYLEATFNNNLPAYPLSSPFNQVQHYKSIVYLGIQTLIDAMTGCKAGLERRRTREEIDQQLKQDQKLGKPTPGPRSTDEEYVPFEGHPFCDVLRHPNNVDTFGLFMAQIIIQWHLTGRVLIWGVPNKVGAPEKMFVIPTALATPAYGLGSQYYPKGGWRIQQYYPASGLMGILPGPLAGTAGAIIDSREIYVLQNPHALYRWAPTSPLQAAQIGTDLLEMIDQSCWSVMMNGVKPSGVFDMPGAGEEVIKATQVQFDNIHAGPDNHGRVMVVGGGNPSRPAGTFASVVPTADVMGFQVEWDRYAGFVLATVCGLDLGVVGLKTQGSYAERWAAIQDVRVRKYEPFLARIADCLTDGPGKDWGLHEYGVRVCLELPKMADPTILEQQNTTAAADGTMTYNEIRARRGQNPAPEIQLADGTLITGDVPTSIYMALVQKQYGLDPITEQMQLTEFNTQMMIEQANAQAEAEGASNNTPAKKKSSNDKGKSNKKSKSNAETGGSNKDGPKRPKNEGGKGAKGGKGSGGKRMKKGHETKAIKDPHDYSAHALARSMQVGDRIATDHAWQAMDQLEGMDNEQAATHHLEASARHSYLADRGKNEVDNREAAQRHSDAAHANNAFNHYHDLYHDHNLPEKFGPIDNSDPAVVADYLEENHNVDPDITHHIRKYLAPHWGVKSVLDDTGGDAITHSSTQLLGSSDDITNRDIRLRLGSPYNQQLATPYEPLVAPPSGKVKILDGKSLRKILQRDMSGKKRRRSVKAKSKLFNALDYSDAAHRLSAIAAEDQHGNFIRDTIALQHSRIAVGHSDAHRFLGAYNNHLKAANEHDQDSDSSYPYRVHTNKRASEAHIDAAHANLMAHYHQQYLETRSMPASILADYIQDRNHPEEHAEQLREFGKRHNKSVLEIV